MLEANMSTQDRIVFHRAERHMTEVGHMCQDHAPTIFAVPLAMRTIAVGEAYHASEPFHIDNKHDSPVLCIIFCRYLHSNKSHNSWVSWCF